MPRYFDKPKLEGFASTTTDPDDDFDDGNDDDDDDVDDDDDGNDLDYCAEEDPRHGRLLHRPALWAAVGVTQTLLSSGVIFGWASLLPVLRDSGVDFSAQAFSLIFTAGAIGNYMTTLCFGILLDHAGPRITGIVASLLYAVGLVLCSFIHDYDCFAIGFFMIGFAGPGIQMPTLHLANLFGGSGNGEGEGGGTGAAVYMSAQAAAFDGGTAIFALVRLIFQLTGFSASTFFLLYLIVPAWSLLTAMLVWPNTILPTPGASSHGGAGTASSGEEAYLSPYLSPSGRRSMRGNSTRPHNLVNAPLSTVLRHPAFYSLATWAGIHILKLNFVVATINDQLNKHVPEETADHLIDLLGAMLPFGFVALPLVATLLDKAPLMAFELANVIGVAYGAVLAFCPGSKWAQSLVVFPAVACSRQLVFSTLFHQVGASFGFANYGVLLGLINVMVSLFTTIQTPLVNWSEREGSYYWANLLLWIVTFPLFFTVLFSDPTKGHGRSSSRNKNGGKNEKTSLLPQDAHFEYEGNPNQGLQSRESVKSLG